MGPERSKGKPRVGRGVGSATTSLPKWDGVEVSGEEGGELILVVSCFLPSLVRL